MRRRGLAAGERDGGAAPGAGGRAWRFEREDARRRRGAGAAAGDGALLAPLTARIVAVHVEEGASVAAGQALVVLEAMKMEHTLVAPFAGVVAELPARPGGQRAPGRCWRACRQRRQRQPGSRAAPRWRPA